MIKSNLIRKSNGEIKVIQICDVVCDECNKEFKLAYYYILNGREKYKKDLCRSCKTLKQYKNGLRKSGWVYYNKKQIGKTFEDRFGNKKAKKLKQQISNRTSGKNNPMYGRNDQCHGFKKENEKRKGKTFKEIFGEEKAEIILKKQSEKSKGKNNAMYGKPSPQGSGNGWSGKYKGYYFRSLLELSYLKYLIDNGIKFKIAEIKEFQIKYYDIYRKNYYNYYPDFYLEDTQEIIEVKPKNLIKSQQNKNKFKAAKKQFGNKFKIITDINKLSFEEIKILCDNGDLIFDRRYQEKYNKIIEGNKNGKQYEKKPSGHRRTG